MTREGVPENGRKGEDPGFVCSPEDLAERFGGRLRVFAARRLRDIPAAEDAAQETLRRVLEALQQGRLRNAEALPAFVFQTARHVCQLRMRGEQRRERAMDRLAAGAETTSGEDPLSEIIAAERRSAVRQALEQIGEADRDLLRTLYVEGEDLAQVATRLRVKPGALRVRKHRALRRLAAILGEFGWNDLE